MTSCLGGGTTAYGFNFDFAIKSPAPSSTSTLTSSPTHSPSSTISETSNNYSQQEATTISTKKPRTPRKRPNQTYNEAATLLSTAYPNLFPINKPNKFIKPTTTELTTSEDSSADLLLPFKPIQQKPISQTEPNRALSAQQKPPWWNSLNCHHRELEGDEDFDCESILDEETEEGIDSIFGSSSVVEDFNGGHGERGVPLPSFGLGWKIGFREEGAVLTALRRGSDGGSWWNFPAVRVVEISPGIIYPPPAASVPAREKKKKSKKKMVTKKVEKPNVELRGSNKGLLLKLNYEEVRNAWSERGSPFDGDCSGVPGNDVTVAIKI